MNAKISRRLPTPAYRKNRLLRLQARQAIGVTTRGQRADKWIDIESVWANVVPLTTRTAEAAHQIYAATTHRVFVDYRADVTTNCRLIHGERVLDIGSVADLDDAHVTLELLCMEGPL